MNTQLEAIMGSGENALKVGSNPCRTAKFSQEIEVAGVTNTALTRATAEPESATVRFPKRTEHRDRVLAKV
jgi:hypothetical protein